MKATLVVIGALAGVVLLLVFATGLLDARGRSKSLCDNSLCISAPAGWHTQVRHGAMSKQLVLAPFPLGEERNFPFTPAGKFEIQVFDHWPYRFGFPRRDVVSIRGSDIKPTRHPYSPSLALRRVFFHGHSLEVVVEFGDRVPAIDQIESVNSILATIRRTPPPKPTK
jgi:hypothetical protein